MIKKWLFAFFNLFYVPYYYKFCKKEIKKLPPGTQLFFLTRRDFGTYLHLLHYIACWERYRGKTALVVLTGYFDMITQLAGLVCPSTHLIGPNDRLTCKAIRYFRGRRIHLESFAKVYARLAVDYQEALYIYHEASCTPPPSLCSPYHVYFDQGLTHWKERLPQDFCEAYVHRCKSLDYRENVYHDMFHLSHQMTDFTDLKKRIDPILTILKRKLSLKNPYIVININCKDYSLLDSSTNRKKICYPERYNEAIDYLISEGYDVVIQGRGEQPLFSPRKGLIDYSKSSFTSAENDLALYAGAFFALLSKTGPENFATLTGTPILSVNFVEPLATTPNPKMRFFPKHLKKNDIIIPWQEILQKPCYFDYGRDNFDPDIVYEEMSAWEIVTAVKEFLILAKEGSWDDLTSLQVDYKKALNPLHLDQYRVKGVPCNNYLRSS